MAEDNYYPFRGAVPPTRGWQFGGMPYYVEPVEAHEGPMRGAPHAGPRGFGPRGRHASDRGPTAPRVRPHNHRHPRRHRQSSAPSQFIERVETPWGAFYRYMSGEHQHEEEEEEGAEATAQNAAQSATSPDGAPEVEVPSDDDQGPEVEEVVSDDEKSKAETVSNAASTKSVSDSDPVDVSEEEFIAAFKELKASIEAQEKAEAAAQAAREKVEVARQKVLQRRAERDRRVAEKQRAEQLRAEEERRRLIIERVRQAEAEALARQAQIEAQARQAQIEAHLREAQAQAEARADQARAEAEAKQAREASAKAASGANASKADAKPPQKVAAASPKRGAESNVESGAEGGEEKSGCSEEDCSTQTIAVGNIDTTTNLSKAEAELAANKITLLLDRIEERLGKLSAQHVSSLKNADSAIKRAESFYPKLEKMYTQLDAIRVPKSKRKLKHSLTARAVGLADSLDVLLERLREDKDRLSTEEASDSDASSVNSPKYTVTLEDIDDDSDN